MAPHSSTVPRKPHERRSLVGCSPWGSCQSDTTERLHFHFSLSCIGEGNGNPLQCSCLENPRDGSLVGCRLWGRTESDTTEVIQQQQQDNHMVLSFILLIIILINFWILKQPYILEVTPTWSWCIILFCMLLDPAHFIRNFASFS